MSSIGAPSLSSPISIMRWHSSTVQSLNSRTESRCPLGKRAFNARQVRFELGFHHLDYVLPASIVTSSPCCAILRISSVIFIEQYFGPHMLQKWAALNVSCGSVSS